MSKKFLALIVLLASLIITPASAGAMNQALSPNCNSRSNGCDVCYLYAYNPKDIGTKVQFEGGAICGTTFHTIEDIAVSIQGYQVSNPVANKAILCWPFPWSGICDVKTTYSPGCANFPYHSITTGFWDDKDGLRHIMTAATSATVTINTCSLAEKQSSAA